MALSECIKPKVKEGIIEILSLLSARAISIAFTSFFPSGE
jgi:hypothetical protein